MNTNLTVCSKGHDEVCYVGRYCPVCGVMDDLTSTIQDLKEQIQDLENQIADGGGYIDG